MKGMLGEYYILCHNCADSIIIFLAFIVHIVT
jgi:hypothetical protein